MRPLPPGVLALDWATSRPVDWPQIADLCYYDGVLAGVVRFEDPAEEFAFQAVAMLYKPEGLDVRLAEAWPVELGTRDPLESAPWVFGEDFRRRDSFPTYIIDERGGAIESGARSNFLGGTPIAPPVATPLLIALRGSTVVGVWAVSPPRDLNYEEMGDVLLSRSWPD